FAPLPGLTGAHVGWFWKLFLGKEWVKVDELAAVPNQFERFDDEGSWVTPGIQFGISQVPPIRYRITNEDGTRTVQLQHTRFIYNWQKHKGSAYPSYETTRREFDSLFSKFCDFLE